MMSEARARQYERPLLLFFLADGRRLVVRPPRCRLWGLQVAYEVTPEFPVHNRERRWRKGDCATITYREDAGAQRPGRQIVVGAARLTRSLTRHGRLCWNIDEARGAETAETAARRSAAPETANET